MFHARDRTIHQSLLGWVGLRQEGRGVRKHERWEEGAQTVGEEQASATRSIGRARHRRVFARKSYGSVRQGTPGSSPGVGRSAERETGCLSGSTISPIS